ncbi:phosphopantetheine-binding protein [Photorhabdus sp. RM105S]|uniref:phosphopantetheine-binding protein n=1 Tax=Photorhabdus sp. RM105S TaxID=3342823 RepID=UPI000DD6E1DA
MDAQFSTAASQFYAAKNCRLFRHFLYLANLICFLIFATTDNLGAHSLTISKIVALTARDLCCRLNIADIFQHNTIRKLAEYIENKAVATEHAIAIAEERRTSLSPQQNLLWYLSALNPDDCSYTLPLAVEIRGHLAPTNV